MVRLSRAVELALADRQLTVSQFRILDRLAGGTAAGRSLAESLAVKPPSITTLVDGLVVRGFVARSVDAADRRRVSHSLTREGRAVYDEARRVLAGRLAQLVGYLDDSDRAASMLRALAGWNEALDLAREAKQRDNLTQPRRG